MASRVPAAAAVAERQDALLRPRLVLVAAAAAKRRVEAVLGDGVEQRDGLQAVAAGSRPWFFHHATVVDRVLDAGHEQVGADGGDKAITELEDVREVVASVHVHDREREPGRRERSDGDVQEHR